MKTRQKNRSFTLLELVVVVIILGILATLGYSQYTGWVEKSRTAEAILRLGVMRNFAKEYYLKNGLMDSIWLGDLGIEVADTTCTTTSYYKYTIGTHEDNRVVLTAIRCTDDGKVPDASREYTIWMMYYADTGDSTLHCYYSDDSSPCFGYPGL